VKDDKTFYIHHSILAKASRYFRAALEGGFREAEEKKVNLPEVAVEVFEMFVEWAYTTIEQKRLEALALADTKDENTDKQRELFSNLSALYIFADGHEVPDLETTSINMLFELLAGQRFLLPRRSDVGRVASKIRPGCTLWRLLVDVQCIHDVRGLGKEYWTRMVGNKNMLPTELVGDMYVRQSLVMGMIRNGALDFDYKLTICDYHDHANQAERDTCPRNKTE
jgi:hypothetical protein